MQLLGNVVDWAELSKWNFSNLEGETPPLTGVPSLSIASLT